MDRFDLIYENVQERKVKVRQHKPIIIKSHDNIFSGNTLYFILSKVKYLRKYYNSFEQTVKFDIGKVDFADKITYLLLDMILYDLFKNTKLQPELYIDVDLKRIINQGVRGTTFYRITENEKLEWCKETYITEYEKKISISATYFRKYITREHFNNDIQLQSRIISDIVFFLNSIYDDSIWVDDVCDVVAELLDNIYSHTNSDCLIDIDVCNANDKYMQAYKVLNIAVINFSEERIFEKIKNNLIKGYYPKEDSLYESIYHAYDNHTKFFNESYQEDDFFQMTAFQNGVTSRNVTSGNSGKGLTSMIKNIVGKTYESYSYVLSGVNILHFVENYLEVNENGFIGFNPQADYINSKPADDAILKSGLYIPGTIFHISLVNKILSEE